jgi:hypothetical protein
MAKRSPKPKAPAKKPKPLEFDEELLAELQDKKRRALALAAFDQLLAEADPKATLWYLERMVGKAPIAEGPNKATNGPALIFNFPGLTRKNRNAFNHVSAKHESTLTDGVVGALKRS